MTRHLPPAMVALVLVTTAVVVNPSPAAAGPCKGEGRIDDEIGVVEGWCDDASPAGPGSSMERLWELYCEHTSFGPYRDGEWVKFERQTVLRGDELDEVNGDPDRDFGVFVVYCHRTEGEFVQWDPLIWALSPPVDPTTLRDNALARIDPPAPSIATSPPVGVPAIVGVDTWLWTEDPWQPIIEADAEGGVSVEVVATPVEVRWDFGDGGVVTCAGPGSPWHELAEPTHCSHRFIRSSAGQPGDAFPTTVTAVWTLTWSLNDADQGSLGTLDRTSSSSVAVAESHALADG